MTDFWARGPPGVAAQTPSKNHHLLVLFFYCVLMDFGSLLTPSFEDFLCFLHSFFEHDFGIVFSFISVWILVSCLMVV